MKPLVPHSVRVVSLLAATGITALIIAAHGMDRFDLGAHEVLVSAPVATMTASTRETSDAAQRIR
jgi:hypothetical protein